MPDITVDRLRQVLNYDPETGVFTWRKTAGAAKKGRQAGTENGKGYLKIRVDGVLYYAHRLAWLYIHGAFPAALLDHANRKRDDNRISNLRGATSSENLCNRLAVRPPGMKGATLIGSCWRAQIKYGGKNKYLGQFDTLEEAHEVYCLAADMIFGEFASHA